MAGLVLPSYVARLGLPNEFPQAYPRVYEHAESAELTFLQDLSVKSEASGVTLSSLTAAIALPNGAPSRAGLGRALRSLPGR